MRRMIGWWGLLLLLIGLGGYPRGVQAAGAGFTVTPQLPQSQIGGDTGWFNLLVQPGQQQMLPVVVTNQSDEAKKLRLALTNAYTQANGQVGYQPNTRRDPSVKLQLTAIGSKPTTVELAPHTSRQVVFRVTVPAAGFEGQILGAIYVQDQPAPPSAASQGLMVTNQFAMVIAVQLQTNERLLAPELKLAAVTANATAVQVRLQNPKARLFGKMSLVAKLVNLRTNQTVLTQREANYQMAPTSSFAYKLQPEQDLPAGDYQVQISATAGKYRWQLRRRLHLTTPVAAALPAPPPDNQPFNWWWLSPIGALAVLGMGIWLGRRQKR